MSEGQQGERLSGNFSQDFSQFSQSGVSGGVQGAPQNTVPQGSFPNNYQSPVIPSGTGDIILNSDSGSGKGKRKWIVFAVVLVVLMVLALGGVAVWNSGVLENEKSSGENVVEKQDFSEVKLKFNILANYALSGDQADDDISLTYNSEVFYFLEIPQDVDRCTEILSDLNTVFEAFFVSYSTLSDEEKLVAKLDPIVFGEKDILRQMEEANIDNVSDRYYDLSSNFVVNIFVIDALLNDRPISSIVASEEDHDD